MILRTILSFKVVLFQSLTVKIRTQLSIRYSQTIDSRDAVVKPPWMGSRRVGE